MNVVPERVRERSSGPKHARHDSKSRRETAYGIQFAAVVLGFFSSIVSGRWIRPEFQLGYHGSLLFLVWMFGWMILYWVLLAAVFTFVEAVDKRRKAKWYTRTDEFAGYFGGYVPKKRRRRRNAKVRKSDDSPNDGIYSSWTLKREETR